VEAAGDGRHACSLLRPPVVLRRPPGVASYLSTLAQEAGVDVPEDTTKAKASEMIDELQGKTGRGQ
jgi:hypothetical protein